MRRERATAAEDLPHRYDDAEGLCTLCQCTEPDPRHVAWERERAAEEESSPQFPRELGT